MYIRSCTGRVQTPDIHRQNLNDFEPFYLNGPDLNLSENTSNDTNFIPIS